MPLDIMLRAVTTGDFEFLWHLHNAALRQYVEQTWGWDEAWQRKHFTENFNCHNGKIITIDGQEAGFLWVSEREDEIFLISIRILPEFQNRGIATRLITELISKADKPIRLRVLKVNPAQRLYERLGFSITGDLETHYEMVRKHSPG